MSMLFAAAIGVRRSALGGWPPPENPATTESGSELHGELMHLLPAAAYRSSRGTQTSSCIDNVNEHRLIARMDPATLASDRSLRFVGART